MDIKYLGYADSHSFTKEDLQRVGIDKAPKDGVTFTQGEGSVQSVSKAIGDYLIAEHSPLFAEVTDDNRDITNAGDTSAAPATPAFAPAAAAPVVTGDTTTPGDEAP